MKIKDYRDAQLHYTKDDRGDATGAFEMFVAEEPRSMVPEPRRTGFSNGGSYDYGSMQYKIDSVKAAYRRYKKGSQTGGRGGKMTFEQFAPIWAKENFADGGAAGQLVQPNADGSRPGYNGRGGPRPNTGGDRSQYIDYEIRIKNPGKKKLDIAEKVHGNKPEYKGLKGFELWKELENFQRSNIVQETTTGEPGFKPKKNQLGKDDFIKLVSDNKGKTYNEFVEIIKKFKTKDGKPFTKQIIADRLRAYKLSGSFKREEAQGPDKTKKAAAEKKRKLNLKEVDPTKAKGVGDFQYHHVRQIAGGVPLTTDDVLIINQRINAQIGGATNKALNRISEAIRKNNKLALEAMNAKNEGLALEYIKRSDNLNAQAEKIVNSAIDKLPEKYKGYVGFNQVSLPTNEYGLPISNEPMIIKKVGGMPVSKNAIDLTTLNLEQEAEFRKIVREQAEAGKTGKINIKKLQQDLLKLAATKNKKCKGLLSYGGRVGLAEGLSPEFCINEGKKVARDLVAKNIKGSPAQNSIMKRITSGVTNFAKSILDPKELFDIKKQLFSKGALMSIPIFDAVMAADDALRKDMDPKEAFAKTFIFGTLPRAMGFTDSIDVINAKKMLEDPNLSPAGKEYAQLIIDSGNYEKMQSDTTGGMTKKFTKFKEMQEKIKNASTAGRFDYEKLLTEKAATEKAGEYVGEPQKVGPGSYVAFDGEEVRKVNEYGYARKGTTFDAPDKPDVTPLVNKLATPAKSRGPMTEMKKQKVDYTPLTYQNYKPFSFTKEEFENMMRQEGKLADDEIYDDTFYNKEIETPMKAEQFKEYMELPSFKGSQFAGGGLAGLSGGDKSGPPPESGPASQGLRSLIKNGRKL